MEHISGFWLYVLAMLPDIKNALDFSNGLAFLTFAFIVGFVVMQMARAFSADDYRGEAKREKKKEFDKTIKKWLPYKTIASVYVLLMVLTFASNFIPNYKQAAVIIGGTWAVNNENVRQLPDDIAVAVRQLVQEVGGKEIEENEEKDLQ